MKKRKTVKKITLRAWTAQPTEWDKDDLENVPLIFNRKLVDLAEGIYQAGVARGRELARASWVRAAKRIRTLKKSNGKRRRHS